MDEELRGKELVSRKDKPTSKNGSLTKVLGTVTALIVAIVALLNTPTVDRFFRKLETPSQSPLSQSPAASPTDKIEQPIQPTNPVTTTELHEMPITKKTISKKEPLYNVPAPDFSPNKVQSEEPHRASQQCEVGSVCIGHDNNGSVDVYLDKPKIPERNFSADSAKRLHDDLSQAIDGHVTIVWSNNPSRETLDFAKQLGNVFRSSGWRVDTGHGEFHFKSRGGNLWGWQGKGFVCTNYITNDENAVIAVRAINKIGFPCEERPEYLDSNGLFLLVGSRGPSNEEDE